MLKTIQPTPSQVSSGPNPINKAAGNNDANGTKSADTKTTNKTKAKNAPSLEERSFLVGICFDLIKTLTRITTGSYLPSVISNFLKDSHITMEESIYKTTFDDLCSRFLCDMTNSIAERLFNGKTKIFGVKIFKLPSEISSQLLSIQTVFLSRTATRKLNTTKESAKHNSTDEEKELEAEVKKRPFMKVARFLSDGFQKNVKPSLDVLLKYCLGIEDGKEVKDSQGKTILKEDGKPLKTQPKVNYPWFLTSIGGSFLASLLLLPKKTQQAGFADVNGSPLRGVFNILWNTFHRLNTTVISSATNIHAEGKNFDACFENAVQDKTFLPFVQYACDAFASVLSDKLPFINGFSLSTILRIVTEIPITFLKSGVQRIAKDNRISDEWSYLSYKILKPFANGMEKLTKPLIKFLTQNVYTRFPFPFIHEWRIFDPKIKNMYDVDIQKNEAKAKDGSDEFEGNWFKTMWLLVKHSFLVPFEVYDLMKEGNKQYAEKEEKIANTIKTHEAKIEEAKFAKQLTTKLAELGINPDQVRNTNVTFAKEEPVKAISSENKMTQIKNLSQAV